MFSNLWLIARLYVGYTWLTSGMGKIGNPAWMQTGEALRAFWERAVAIPEAPARPLIAFGWYRDFILTLLEGGHYAWFSPLIAIAELLVGALLIFGWHKHIGFSVPAVEHCAAVQPDDNDSSNDDQQTVPGLGVRPDGVHHLEVIEHGDQEATP